MAICFVQPFDKGPYDKRYEDTLKPAITDAGLEPYRVDQDPSVTVPIDDIETHIRDADICLADISTNNPNVWYEVGFAFANGKPVVLICAEPRGESFPFDIRHRHVISYATHSMSDFEKLKKDVTAKLKAQLQKAEKLQTASTMAQIKPTEGLAAHEIAVLFTIISNARMPDDGMPPFALKESMKRSGYTPVASTLALASLSNKGLMEYGTESSDDGDYTVCKLTERGIKWMLDHQNEFRLEAIKDEDIPF